MITAISQSLENQGPPVFNSELVNQEANEGLSLTYKFPGISDPDNDSFTVIVILGSSMMFTTFDSKKNLLIFNPLLSQVSQNPYQIRVKLTDQNPYPKSSSYTLLVTVVSNSTTNSVFAGFNQSLVNSTSVTNT